MLFTVQQLKTSAIVTANFNSVDQCQEKGIYSFSMGNIAAFSSIVSLIKAFQACLAFS